VNSLWTTNQPAALWWIHCELEANLWPSGEFTVDYKPACSPLVNSLWTRSQPAALWWIHCELEASLRPSGEFTADYTSADGPCLPPVCRWLLNAVCRCRHAARALCCVCTWARWHCRRDLRWSLPTRSRSFEMSTLQDTDTTVSFCRTMLCISAAYAIMRCLCVSVSVCLSRSCIVSKRIKISSIFFTIG